MRVFIGVLTIALMTVSANAQEMGKGRRHQQDAQKTEDKTKSKANEQAYKDALSRIPAPKEKPDPWKTMR